MRGIRKEETQLDKGGCYVEVKRTSAHTAELVRNCKLENGICKKNS
jgi:hypothetical protein